MKPFSPHGTAFLIDQGETLVTAWHVVFAGHAAPLHFLHHYIASRNLEEKKSLYKNLEPAFILLDQEGTIVFDTQNEGPSVQYQSIGDPLSTIYSIKGKKLQKPYGHYENIPDDYAVISLPRAIGKALSVKRVESPDLEGKCLYSAGFSYNQQVEKYQVTGGGKSTLSKLQVKLGNFSDFQLRPLPRSKEELLNLPIKDFMRLMGYKEDEIQAQLKKYDKKLIRQSIAVIIDSSQRNMRDQLLDQHKNVLFFKGAVMSGQSGGPIFNSKGEVLGITTNGFIKSQNNHLVSIGGAGILFSEVSLL